MRLEARRTWLAGLTVAASGVLLIASLYVGSGSVQPARVGEIVLGAGAGGPESVIVWQLRFPRAVVALLAGGALGMAGALTQSLTRNPLAEPGLLGVNAGAGLGVALGIVVLDGTTVLGQLVLACIGAAVSGVVVLTAGGVITGRYGTVRLVLAGAAWSAMTSAVTTFLVLADERAFDGFRHWSSGAVEARPWALIAAAAALALAAVVMIAPVLGAIDALGLGDDMGRALGAAPRRTWAVAGLTAVILCGGATALVGPVSFLGLVAPMAVRWVTGPRVGPLLVWSGVVGGLLLLAADVGGRVVLPPQEVSAAVMCGLVGAPLFVLVARRMRVVSL